MGIVTKKVATNSTLNTIVERKKTKREQRLLKLAEEAQKIAAKHNMKPFNRKDFYASL